jgi:hypothetical protein
MDQRLGFRKDQVQVQLRRPDGDSRRWAARVRNSQTSHDFDTGVASRAAAVETAAEVFATAMLAMAVLLSVNFTGSGSPELDHCL